MKTLALQMLTPHVYKIFEYEYVEEWFQNWLQIG